uniref:Uncharacterized protein n=1 Tax=Arion vulgaris TaxID=1028688 RepID=A0A0B7AFL5_9EUPU
MRMKSNLLPSRAYNNQESRRVLETDIKRIGKTWKEYWKGWQVEEELEEVY